MTTLRDHGYRFVLRAGRFIWSHKMEIAAGDIDCTEMTDDELEALVRSVSRP